jgi:protein ImuB
MLWLALYLPNLPLEVFARGGHGSEPFVVCAGEGRGNCSCIALTPAIHGGRAQQVLIANERAAQCGVQPGMSLGAAHVLAQSLRAHPRDERAEQAALERLAAWAGQFTSAVSISPPATLLLEVQGSLTLFGGLKALCARVQAGVAGLGFQAALAVAPTPLAATWLARAGGPKHVTNAAQLAGALAPLPLACMDATAAQRETLHGMGVRTVGDCLRLPRAGLARRIGNEFVALLDRALGRAADPRAFYCAPPRYQGSIALPGSVEHSEGIVFALQRLLRELGGFLIARGAGVAALTLTLHHPTRALTRIELGLVAPTRDVEHLTALWRERLARVELPAAVEEITLQAPQLVPLAQHAVDFFVPRHAQAEARAALIERLRARLGDAAVRGLAQVAEHRPERAWRYVAPGEADENGGGNARPLWLLASPLPLEERGGQPYFGGVLALECERERIESGWWDDDDVRRDYFIARSPQGARLWIYRELDSERRWFLHGVFA